MNKYARTVRFLLRTVMLWIRL